MWNNLVELERPQMTIRRMRIACWIPKATNIHSEYLLLFHCNDDYTNAPQRFVIRTVHCLSCFLFFCFCFCFWQEVAFLWLARTFICSDKDALTWSREGIRNAMRFLCAHNISSHPNWTRVDSGAWWWHIESAAYQKLSDRALES